LADVFWVWVVPIKQVYCRMRDTSMLKLVFECFLSDKYVKIQEDENEFLCV
jgi:hypothetical protein